MLCLPTRVVAVAALSLAVAACTQANPGYQGGDSTVSRDGSDGPSARDGRDDGPSGDATVDQIVPDVVPSVCQRDQDCDDGRDCTDDRCDKQAQKCINTLKSNRCLIGGRCYRENDAPSDGSCSVCRPDADPTAWSSKTDGSPCADDGLSCTNDVCTNGKCEHEVSAGNCLIGGKCLADGDVDPADSCKECASAASTTQTTFVDGKECTKSSGLAAFCVRSACRDVVEDNAVTVGSANVSSSQLDGVAKVSGSGVWAVGRFTTDANQTQGVIARLDGTTFTTPQISPEPLNGISHQLAIGENGIAYRFSGTSWGRSASLEAKLNNRQRLSVWGTSVGNTSIYLIGGVHNNPNTEPGVWECRDTLGVFTCSAATATMSKGARIGALFGTAAGASYGPSWGAAFGTYEDIYFRDGTGKWTWNGPGGCFDGQGTACDNTDFHDFTDMNGSGHSDVWAVGTSGLIVRYDGQKWTRLATAISSQTDYDFDAVFSEPASNLVTIAAHHDVTTNREIVLFNYNIKLDRWFGPIVLRTFGGQNRGGNVADIGGEGYANMWLVGRRPQASSATNGATDAWALYLK